VLEEIRKSFEAQIPKEIVDQLLETYIEVKREYYLGHLRPNEVEGGRFAEAGFRVLESRTTGAHTPLGRKIKDFERRCEDLRNLPSTKFPDSVRLHIPRTLRLIYDIRSKRDAVHLADGIDPNLQDAGFIVASCDWVMAELIRLFHNVTPDQAHMIVDALVQRRCPSVQKFGDFFKTLNPKLGVSDRIVVLLYEKGLTGATTQELESWLKPSQRQNLNRTLHILEHEKDFVVRRNSAQYVITNRGILYAEQKGLLNPPEIN